MEVQWTTILLILTLEISFVSKSNQGDVTTDLLHEKYSIR